MKTKFKSMNEILNPEFENQRNLIRNEITDLFSFRRSEKNEKVKKQIEDRINYLMNEMKKYC